MNHLQLIETIISKLKENGFGDLSQEVAETQSSATMGGELIMTVSSKLVDIKRDNPTAYSIISSEVEELIEFANSTGLYPRFGSN